MCHAGDFACMAIGSGPDPRESAPVRRLYARQLGDFAGTRLQWPPTIGGSKPLNRAILERAGTHPSFGGLRDFGWYGGWGSWQPVQQSTRRSLRPLRPTVAVSG